MNDDETPGLHNDMAQLGERMERLEKNAADTNARLRSIESKLDKLIVTVRGNAEYGSRGLGPRVVELERRMDRVETIINRALWLATGMGFAGWGIGELIQQLLGG